MEEIQPKKINYIKIIYLYIQLLCFVLFFFNLIFIICIFNINNISYLYNYPSSLYVIL